MQPRQLGRSPLRLAPLMLGSNVFGWNTDEKTSHAILDAFIEKGFNAIDTADSYSRWAPGHKGGESETVIGNWLKKGSKRSKVVIATKLGEDMGEGRSLKGDYVLRACEASLKRLQTDYIDLYQTHFDDEVTPVEETLAAYAKLIAQGKVRVIGASNLSASLESSKRLGIPRYESLQPLYNLSDRREFETEYAPIVRAEGLGVINYYSLAAGFLTGKYRSLDEALKHPNRGGRLKRYADARGFRILAAMREVGARHNATPAQVAIAWLIAQSLITAAIASATSLKQLEEIMQAPQVKLGKADLAALDQASVS